MHSNVDSYLNSTHMNQSIGNPCSESSPSKTRSMALRELGAYGSRIEASPIVEKIEGSPSSAKKSHKSRRTRISPDKENLENSPPKFSIDIQSA